MLGHLLRIKHVETDDEWMWGEGEGKQDGTHRVRVVDLLRGVLKEEQA